MYSISTLARTAGVTSRTLRHYDRIGLLQPAHVDESGRRFYERDQLRRLQRILVLRELGVRLDSIGEVLAGERAEIDVLRMQHRWLLAERDRLGRLADTVAATIEETQGGRRMSAEQMFAGFSDPRYGERLAEEARRRWGKVATESQQQLGSWSQQQWDAHNTRGAEITNRIAELAASGAASDESRVLDTVAEHYEWISQHWTPDAESYTGLGRLYAEDERFRRQYEAVQPGLADYLRDAIAAYAGRRLS